MKNLTLLSLITSFIFLHTSCKMEQKADFIGYNGNIYTVDSLFTKAEAFAIKDGKFIDVGTNDKILSKYKVDPKTGVKKDFKGATIYPGFQDSHCHIYGLGSMLNYVNLKGVKSFQCIIDSLVLYKEKNPDAKFIIGEGWDQNLWETKEFPNNAKLNELFPDIPIVLTRIDYHASLVNDAAIKKAKIDPKEFNKQYPGIFLENICEEIKNAVIEYTEEDIAKAILDAQKECFKNGLTSVCSEEDITTIRIMDSLVKSGEYILKTDIWLSASKDGMAQITAPYKNNNIKVETLKLYADGALGSRGATLLEPYQDNPNNTGIDVTQEQEFRDLCKWAYEHNLKVATHAIGDRANRRTLDIYIEFINKARETNPKANLNWRIEHSQIVNKDDINKFGKYSIIPSVQPTHCTSDMFWAQSRLGNRIADGYKYKSLLKENGWIPSGTDFPIEEVNPFFTFFAAVFRKNINLEPSEGFQSGEALTRQEALRSMTIWGAKVTQEENKKGSIEVGKEADFIVCDIDILNAKEKEILGAKINSTYLNGKLVWQRL